MGLTYRCSPFDFLNRPSEYVRVIKEATEHVMGERVKRATERAARERSALEDPRLRDEENDFGR